MSESRAKTAAAPRKINQADIARRAEVSISTVSRALSGAPGTRPEVRARILEIASSMGYSVPEALVSERVAVFLPMHPVTGGLHQVFQENFDGVKDAAAEHGVDIFPYLMPEADITLDRIRGIMDDHQTRNAICFYADLPDDLSEYFRDEGTMVIVNNIDPKMRFDAILPDNYSGSAMMTEHVIAAGHRKIAFLVGNLRQNPKLRLAAFRDVAAAHPEVEAEVINIGYDREETAYEHFRRFFATHGKPEWTAAVCANDLMALGVLQAAWEAGLKVPDDFSVTGFDNIGWSQMATPRLTTLDVDRREMGREAVRMLRRRIATPDAPVHTVLQGCTFLAGASVAPPAD
ncbi:LacI family DNA-binding transcriptional regulator [Psychromarinibacter sp. S121]|uniref:LacI family DNA-binding transcriptional regulator n=1 Tax=Psychromarinibacter sp. S121 TaxID=3415127 RepID=UPI003C7C9336